MKSGFNVPRSWVVINVLLGTLTVSLSNSSLNPALPTFMEAFRIGPLMATWIVAAFMTSMGMTMPLTSFLSQRVGRKRLYLWGVALFIGGSLLGALANSIALVIAARVVQGVASGLMIPLSLAIIFAVYEKHERGRVTGLWSAAVMLAPALGPLCGSLLLEWFSWRSLFLMNVPIGLLALVLGSGVLPASEPPERKPFDLVGYLLIASGIGLLMVAISRMHHAEALLDPLNQGMVLVAVTCLIAFVRVELRRKDPLLNLRLFNLHGYRLSVIVAVVQSVGMFECLVLLPLLVQTVMGYNPIWTGLSLLCTAAFASLFGQWGGKALDRHGPRKVVAIGLLLTGLSTLALGLLQSDAAIGMVFVVMMVRGAGLGLSYMPITTAGLNALPEPMVTQGAAMNNISRRLVASLGIVIASLWLEFRLSSAGPTATPSAISEVFIATGLLILLALPCAWRFPVNEKPMNEKPVNDERAEAKPGAVETR
ncbi:DHA2 family efflux MFS transporter permease subunit [Pseudomonas alliivorans]|uniref:DHA2 family efflux MFS transporter permease subunit n=1 Tax=Pseudomonas alliivorans TaxID=2810613 RepID=UPI001AE9EBE2|nr:DHA2 family efflux MFS transporter permease subunit [Pseudomonas alliivorans]MBP0942809.1 DHA2 family efflux MFS transporter permease subunit [Pseudomonas alliivorans]MEE4880903.1 DHA2 family efflux MFS transporter permease subunit [Pseudomonas alliivorans]MEE4932234.1 DHA2 family efflux MFS transporter permease subunit [Pseudomonas alliivorans]MEE4937788.1 DHA2 family efflux MFS transporter permease subunit [Pseudomonas alliivorans]MEE4942776.1 DHA2 family efflux MFS transporter permease s